MHVARPKVIFDPILRNPVDIDSFLPMVDAPEFQLLRDRRQLSLTDIAFPAARHSRFEHSIGSFASTRRLADRWVVLGLIDKDMRRALSAYALYHDIGHGAFSHVTEGFCGDHKARTREIVERLRPAIEASNVDFGLMYALVCHENPVHLAVSDKNIGIEKLDYLVRDGWYTGVGSPTGVEYLRKFMYFLGGQVCIDEKMVEHVVDVQRFYMQMYKNVYLRKCLVIAQRAFHKMLQYVVEHGELDPVSIGDMTDPELLGVVTRTRHPGARALLQRLRERRLLKEAVVIRQDGDTRETRVVDKMIRVVGIPRPEMQALMRAPDLQKENHRALEAAETGVAQHLQIAPHDVVIVPPLYADRFVSKDVMIYGSGGTLLSLRARRPAAFESMEETARSYQAVRICVPDDQRERAYAAAEDLSGFVRALS